LSVEILNFGCRLNLAEGEALRARLAGEDDLVVVNSCAVTAEAERQARQAIRRAASRLPGARIMVTGCGAATDPERYLAMKEVSGLLDKRALLADAPAVSGGRHARAFIEVQNGCDHRCTFCIIPLGRGDSRSRRPEAVIETVRQAVAQGHQEVVLTGVDLTSFGQDLDTAPALGLLVRSILDAVPDLPRLRLSSLDPVEIDPLLFAMLTEHERVMPHVHLSLQHGDDLILKRMKRRHLRSDAVRLVERLKAARPDISIGADLIAGFPTEDDEAFASLVSVLDECDIVQAHVFPYSARPGTAAARMPQLPRSLVRDRAKALRGVAARRRRAWLDSMNGSEQSVLVELDGRTGHTACFAPVTLDRVLPTGNMRGHVVRVRISGNDGVSLSGTVS
jgi:threonylcarbamoyladenosine tRNA methylthiotransferase MtaB